MIQRGRADCVPGASSECKCEVLMCSHLSCVFRRREDHGQQVNIRLMEQPRLRGCPFAGPPSSAQARLPIARGREPWTLPGMPGAGTGRAQLCDTGGKQAPWPDVLPGGPYWRVTNIADRLARPPSPVDHGQWTAVTAPGGWGDGPFPWGGYGPVPPVTGPPEYSGNENPARNRA